MKVLVLSLFFCLTSFAETAIKLKNLEKNKTALPTIEANVFEKQKNDITDVKPPKFDIYTTDNKVQAEYEKTLDKQIDELYGLTKDFKTSPKRGELWLRLAELYIEKANILSDRIMSDFEKTQAKAQQNPEMKPPVLDLTPAKAYNQKALQLYQWYLRDFPNGEKADLALFYFAYQNYELGNINESIDQYKQLVAKFPQSRFLTESHFVIAESYFDNEKWSEALKHYPFVTQNEKSPYYTLALYKSAWCLFRTGRTDAAISNMHQVVRLAKSYSAETTLSGKKVKTSNLDNEAIRDLVVFYADADKIDEAIAYFKALKSQAGEVSIEKLAYYLSSKGNIKSSKKVFKYLISQAPMSAKSFDYQFQITQNYFFSQNKDEFKNELRVLVRDYGTKSPWYGENSKNKEFITEADQKREQVLRNYILQQHQYTQNTRAESSFKEADESYKFYLEEFPQAASIGDMHFLYAELLYDMSRYAEATGQYEVVVNQFQKNQYYDKASLNLLFSLEKTLPEVKDGKKSDEDLNTVPLDAISEKFIKYAEAYLIRYPKYEKAVDLKFRMARIYYVNNYFDLAEKYFKDIIKNYPNSTYTEYSANLLLDIYNLKKDYVGLEKNANELLSIQSVSDSKLGGDIRSILEKTNFKKAQNLDAEANFLSSAQQYMNFTQLYPQSALLGLAYFNSAVNFEKSAKRKEAVNSYQLYLKNSTGSDPKLSHQAKVALAKFYQESGQYALAASNYAELSQSKLSEAALKENYIFNAALMYELIGDSGHSIAQYEQYKILTKNEGEKAETLFKIAELFRKKKSNSEAIKNYKLYLQSQHAEREKQVEAQYWIATLGKDKFSSVELKNLENSLTKSVAAVPQERKARANVYLAKVKILQAEDTQSKLLKTQISTNPKQQQISVAKKIELMKQLNQQLSEVIKLETPDEMLISFYMLGLANEDMVHSLEKVSVPADLNDEEKKLYMAELDKIISPFKEKMVESYVLAVDKGREFSVYGKAYHSSLQKMTELKPADYYSSKEVFRTVRNSKNLSQSDDKDKAVQTLIENPKDIEALNNLAIYYYTQHQYEASMVLLKLAARTSPDHAPTYNNLGIVFMELDELVQAIQMFEKALSLDSNNLDAATNLASIYVSQHDYSKSLSSVQFLTKNETVDAESLNNYAILLAAKGQTEDAAILYEKIRKKYPQHERVLLNYSSLLIKKNNPKRALDLLNQIKVADLNSEYKKIKSDLEVEARAILK